MYQLSALYNNNSTSVTYINYCYVSNLTDNRMN